MNLAENSVAHAEAALQEVMDLGLIDGWYFFWHHTATREEGVQTPKLHWIVRSYDDTKESGQNWLHFSDPAEVCRWVQALPHGDDA